MIYPDRLELLAVATAALLPQAAAPHASDLDWRDRWLAPFLDRPVPPEPAHIEALFEDADDGLTWDRSWRGTPFQIGERGYAHGLALNATKHLRVYVGRPVERFVAEVGLENNDDTRRGAAMGHGSVTFGVRVGGEEVFASPVLRLDDGPLPIAVALGGAPEFEIRVGDGGDVRSWDQALWGEARIVLRDGEEIRLQDLPLQPAPGRPLSPAHPPFSFRYGGRSSSELLPEWTTRLETRRLDAERREHRRTYTDPSTGLSVRWVTVEYADYPVVEWTLFFANAGPAASPILEEIQALDIELNRNSGGEFLLHRNVGSPADGNDYRPLETVLGPEARQRLGGAGGRPTSRDWSYFNLEWGGQGLITAVGWPGQWAADFARGGPRGLRLKAGQELTHFSLLPGEEVRTPLIALLFWKGEWIRAQNLWRRWMIDHAIPRPGGHLPPPQLLASSSRQYGEMIEANEGNQIEFIDRYLGERIGLDVWWRGCPSPCEI
ncbi:MAG: NPCBM/NEW2 domain-containing protein [Planctomycetota bacterium]